MARNKEEKQRRKALKQLAKEQMQEGSNKNPDDFGIEAPERKEF